MFSKHAGDTTCLVKVIYKIKTNSYIFFDAGFSSSQEVLPNSKNLTVTRERNPKTAVEILGPSKYTIQEGEELALVCRTENKNNNLGWRKKV